MKTTLYTLALLTALMMTNNINLGATNLTNSEESYINDIPFDTKTVVNEILADKALEAFCFEYEEYVNDIPFDTESVAAITAEKSVTLPDFEEEQYINDIPFNTEKIAGEAHYKAALTVNFELEEENYVNDIPFNTAYIAEMHNATASR